MIAHAQAVELNFPPRPNPEMARMYRLRGMLHAMTTLQATTRQQYQLHDYNCMAMLHDCMAMHGDVEWHDSTMFCTTTTGW